MLIAAIRSGNPLAGKAVSYSEDDGKFWLTGVGEISPDRLVAYEEAGELEWADDATRSWALQRATGQEVAEATRAPSPAAAERPPALETVPPQPSPQPRRPVSPTAVEPLAPAEGERATLIAAPLARRGERTERPDFVAGERRRWRPSETQWRTIGYVTIGLAMIIAVVVIGVWGFRGNEPTQTVPDGVAARLEGSSTGASEPFELTSGTHRLAFTVERSSLGAVADYTFCVVPVGTAADKEASYAVEQGGIDPAFAAGAKNGEVLFERVSGSYYLKVFSNNCSWTVSLADKK